MATRLTQRAPIQPEGRGAPCREHKQQHARPALVGGRWQRIHRNRADGRLPPAAPYLHAHAVVGLGGRPLQPMDAYPGGYRRAARCACFTCCASLTCCACCACNKIRCIEGTIAAAQRRGWSVSVACGQQVGGLAIHRHVDIAPVIAQRQLERQIAPGVGKSKDARWLKFRRGRLGRVCALRPRLPAGRIVDGRAVHARHHAGQNRRQCCRLRLHNGVAALLAKLGCQRKEAGHRQAQRQHQQERATTCICRAAAGEKTAEGHGRNRITR